MTPIDQLRTTKEKLPPELRAQILALRGEAVPPLLAILVDEQLGASESPAHGWPPIHAVELLADLEATEAIEPMLDVLVHPRGLGRTHRNRETEEISKPADERRATSPRWQDTHGGVPPWTGCGRARLAGR